MFIKHLPSVAFLAFLIAATANAGECPSNIYYTNGYILKKGTNFYYSNGKPLKSGSNFYFANGYVFKRGSNLYYPNGTKLKSGNNLYYPNGYVLKNGNNLYYASGRAFKNGSKLYYDNQRALKNGENYYYSSGYVSKNGSNVYYPSQKIARSRGNLYREDGSRSPLSELVLTDNGSGVDVKYFVTSDDFRAEVILGPQNVEDQIISVPYDIESDAIQPMFKLANGDVTTTVSNTTGSYDLFLSIPTGYNNEFVNISFEGDVLKCSSDSNGGMPREFSISTDVADISVKVKSGYNPALVHSILMDALQSIE